MGIQTPTVNRESQGPRQNGHSPTPTWPFLTIRLRHRFTTFWRVGTLIHNFGRCDSQVRGPDSHFDSQLLAGKLLEWRSLNRDRHSHGACSPRLSFLAITTHLLTPPRLSPPLPPAAFSQ